MVRFQVLGYKLIFFLLFVFKRKFVHFLACKLIDIYHIFNNKDCKIVSKNFSIIYQKNLDKKLEKKLIKKNFYNFILYFIDFLNAGNLSEKNIDQFVQIKNEQYFDQVLKCGKGGICITAHIGNWELGAFYLGLKKYKINAVALNHKNNFVNDIFINTRKQKGINIIPLGKASRECLRVLRNNELLALLSDRIFDKREKAFEIEIFNNKILVPRGPAYLSIKTGAPLIPCFILIKPNGKYIFEINEPVYALDDGDDIDSCADELTKRYFKVVGQYIEKYPEQWYAFQDVWQRSASEGSEQ